MADPSKALSDPIAFGIEELLEQSGLGAMAPMVLQFVPLLKMMGLNALTGTNKSSFKASDFLQRGSVTSLVQRKFRNREFSSMYGDLTEEMEEGFNRQVAEGVFKAFGYSEANARVAADGNLGRMISRLADFGNPRKEGLASLTSALYSRRNLFKVDNGLLESYVSQAHGDRRIIRELTKAFDDREFGRMTFSEVGDVASKLIRTGQFDITTEQAETPDAKTKTTTNARIDRLKGRIKSYSSSLDRLKDVIDGDMSKVLDSMDKLFGGTTIAMSAAKLEKITSSMQHAALITGVDAKTIAQNAGLGYSYIASVGGTQGMGVRMGIEASYYTQNLPSDAWLSKDEMRSATLMALANTTRSQESRSLATAYVLWRQNQQKGADTSMQAFMKTFEGKPVNNQTLMESARASIGTRYKGATPDQITAVYATVAQSEEVLDVEETEKIGSVLLESKVDSLRKARESSLNALYESYSASGGKKSLSDFKKEVAGADGLNRSDVMLKNFMQLSRGLRDEAGLVENASSRFNYMRAFEQQVLGTATGRQAQELMRSTEQGRRLRQQQLYINELSPQVRSVLERAKNEKKSIAEVVSGMSNGAELKTIIASLLGVDVGALNRLNSDAEIKTAMDRLDKVGVSSTSPLAGIRKLPNGARTETAEEARARDAEYTKTRIWATKYIEMKAAGADVDARSKNMGRGKAIANRLDSLTDQKERAKAFEALSAADKQAYEAYMAKTHYDKFLAETEFSSPEHQAIYEGLTAATAKALLTSSSKEELFAYSRRITNIAKAHNINLADADTRKKYIDKVVSARAEMAEARRTHGVEFEKVLHMSDTDRVAHAKKGSKEAAAVASIQKIEEMITGTKGLADGAKKDLLTLVKGSGGTVEGFLMAIISLLTDIRNKK